MTVQLDDNQLIIFNSLKEKSKRNPIFNEIPYIIISKFIIGLDVDSNRELKMKALSLLDSSQLNEVFGEFVRWALSEV